MAETYPNYYWWNSHNPMSGGSFKPIHETGVTDVCLYYSVIGEKNGKTEVVLGLCEELVTQYTSTSNNTQSSSEWRSYYDYHGFAGTSAPTTDKPIVWELKDLNNNLILAQCKTKHVLQWHLESHTVTDSGDSAKPYLHTKVERCWFFSYVFTELDPGTTKLQSFLYASNGGMLRQDAFYLALDSIPIIDEYPSVIDDESNFSITYYNPAQENVEYCQVGIIGSSEILAQYRNISPTGTTYTFTLSVADKKALQAYCSTTNSDTVWLAIRTKPTSMDEVIRTYGITLNIINANPIINPSIIDTNIETTNLTGNNTTLVRYHSNVDVAINATAIKETYLVSKAITYQGKTTSDVDSITINKIEHNNFTFTAKDARGNITTKAVTPTLLPYVKLTCNLSASSPTTNNTLPIDISGNYWNDNFGAQVNTLTIQCRYKSNLLVEYSDWIAVTVTPTYNNHTYQVSFEVNVPNHIDRYTVQVRVIDKLMTIDSREVTVQSYPLFDWGDTDFNFNIPVNVQNDLFIAGTIYPGGAAMMDYIVEQGTKTTGSGNSQANWVYRKWNSGIAECWCRKHVSTAVNTAWGNLYVSGALSYTNITWGVNFVDIPVANITIAPNASGAFLIAGGSTSLSATFTGGYEIARGSALASAGNFYINYYGIGRWK